MRTGSAHLHGDVRRVLGCHRSLRGRAGAPGRPLTGRLLSVVLVLGALALPVGAAPPAVQADAKTYRVKECFYSYGWGRIPLRYGNAEFGYRHIKARRGYTPRLRRMIRRVLASYSTYEPQGDTIVFRRYRDSKVEVVVVGTNRVPRGSRYRMIGIITAYSARWDGRQRRGNLPPLSPNGPDGSICRG